jgi:DNA-binding CsgD family transcriptional regulator
MEPLQQAMPRGTAVTSSRLVADREFERSELYNEVVRPANGFYAVGYRQDFSALSTFVAVCRPRRKGSFATRDTRTLQNLAPLLGTTLELQYRLHVCEQQRAALANVLDKLSRAVMVTDASTRPIFLNKEAERLVAEDDGLSAGCAQLSAATSAATRRLRDAVLETAAHGAVKGQRLRLERPSGRGPLLLTVLPISQLGVASLGASAPRVVIFVDELDEPAAIDRAAIADIFDLTPRESEVATRLTGGSALTTISGALRMSYSTVRTHLLHVFEKTGVHNQAALVALLSRFRKLLVFIPGTSISHLPEMLSHLADAATW